MRVEQALSDITISKEYIDEKKAAATSVVSSRKLGKAQTRRAIMKSALRLYSSEGSAGMSMNKVAKGAGIAQPSFYNHFDSLEVLQQELSAQLKDHYLSPMRAAWITMIKDYAWLSQAQFNQRCEHCLSHIFDAAFTNIDLFQRLTEDRLRASASVDAAQPANKGLGNLINEIQDEWTQIFIEGLTLSNCDFEQSKVNLCVDIAAAQVHELILGCHQQRYTRVQATEMLCENLYALFTGFWQRESLKPDFIT